MNSLGTGNVVGNSDSTASRDIFGLSKRDVSAAADAAEALLSMSSPPPVSSAANDDLLGFGDFQAPTAAPAPSFASAHPMESGNSQAQSLFQHPVKPSPVVDDLGISWEVDEGCSVNVDVDVDEGGEEGDSEYRIQLRRKRLAERKSKMEAKVIELRTREAEERNAQDLRQSLDDQYGAKVDAWHNRNKVTLCRDFEADASYEASLLR
eukprot:gene8564-10166_t